MRGDSQQCHLTVEQLGRSGDGMVRYEGRSYYIPGTLPGEQLHLRFHHESVELLGWDHYAPERVNPPCSLAGRCGGCTLQQDRKSVV